MRHTSDCTMLPYPAIHRRCGLNGEKEGHQVKMASVCDVAVRDHRNLSQMSGFLGSCECQRLKTLMTY